MRPTLARQRGLPRPRPQGVDLPRLYKRLLGNAPPGRQIWTKVECRRYRRSLWTRFWILALAQWLLLGLVLHTFVFTGNTTGGGPGPTSNSGRWAVSLFALSVPNLVIWTIAALITSGHAGKVERQHGWGPWVTWPYPKTTPTR